MKTLIFSAIVFLLLRSGMEILAGIFLEKENNTDSDLTAAVGGAAR